MLKHNDIPLLLKKIDPEVDDLIQEAFNYLKAYDQTRDWGYIPTIQNAIARISIIHMRRTKDGAQSFTNR